MFIMDIFSRFIFKEIILSKSRGYDIFSVFWHNFLVFVKIASQSS